MIAKNTDIKAWDTGLSEAEKRAARREGLAQKARAALGAKWVMAREHAPARGVYNPLTGARLQ